MRAQTPATGGHAIVGPLIRCAAGVLELGAYVGEDEPSYRIPLADIRRLWVRGSAAIWGLVAGTMSGAAAGTALAEAKSTICFRGSPPVSTSCHGNIPASALTGAVLGGALGWGLGRGLPRWVRLTF